VAAVSGLDECTARAARTALGRRPPPAAEAGLRSDFHLGPTTHRATLDNAFHLLREARPDVLLLGGDYVFLGATQGRVNELNDLVRSVPAELKIAVLGNHDFWARPARLEVALSAAGTVILVNEALRLPPPHDDVGIAGLDDPFTSLDQGLRITPMGGGPGPREDRRRQGAHRRLSFAGRADVGARPGRPSPLCGHTRTGARRLAWIPADLDPQPRGQALSVGTPRGDGTTLFVSRGVGGPGALPDLGSPTWRLHRALTMTPAIATFHSERSSLMLASRLARAESDPRRPPRR
jgi:hypothetical protein